MPEVDSDFIGCPHSAITTWSGFIYQGKVAIYHVLHLLNELDDYDGLVLQLDSLEDFSILNGADKIISLHQVKAKKTQYYSGYEADIIKLKGKACEYNCNNTKFHLAREITDKTNQDIATSHSPVEIYNYGQNSWCAVDEIDQEIEDRIKSLLVTLFPGDNCKVAGGYLRKARGYLDQIILKKVLKIHRIVHDGVMSDCDAAYTQKVAFTEFVDILQKDLDQEGLNEKYYYYLLLDYFFRYYQEYCIEHEDLSGDDLKKLSLCMKEIASLSKEEMIQFISSIMPHREFKFNSLRDFKDNVFDKDGIQDEFLTILNELRQPELKPESYFHWHVEQSSYSPTVINKGVSQAGNVCRGIIKNALSTDLDIMFEGCNLITTDINVESITEEAPDLIRGVDSDGRENDRISRWKKVSLVSLSCAKEVIND